MKYFTNAVMSFIAYTFPKIDQILCKHQCWIIGDKNLLGDLIEFIYFLSRKNGVALAKYKVIYRIQQPSCNQFKKNYIQISKEQYLLSNRRRYSKKFINFLLYEIHFRALYSNLFRLPIVIICNQTHHLYKVFTSKELPCY